MEVEEEEEEGLEGEEEELEGEEEELEGEEEELEGEEEGLEGEEEELEGEEEELEGEEEELEGEEEELEGEEEGLEGEEEELEGEEEGLEGEEEGLEGEEEKTVVRGRVRKRKCVKRVVRRERGRIGWRRRGRIGWRRRGRGRIGWRRRGRRGRGCRKLRGRKGSSVWVDRLRDCVRTSYVCEPDSDCELLETPPRACDPPYVLNTPLRRKECGELHNTHSAFVGVTSQVTDLIDQVNATSGCKATSGCTGELKLVRVRLAGLGGAVEMTYSCSECSRRVVTFRSSVEHETTKQTVVGLALQVAFACAGCTHAKYHRALELALGLHTVTLHQYHKTLEIMALHVSALLDEMCEEAKQEMKDMDPSEIGSWERAVTMGDAAWLTRGFHSQNCTFTVRNNITNSLLYYEHLCQRGEDEYKGTSKAAEGFGAERVFKRAKEEGLEIEVHWQDKDSSSSKALKSNFPTAQLVYCSGHAARNHEKHLKYKIKTTKSFTDDQVKKHSEVYPDVATATCHCKKHMGTNCGCITPGFITRARANFNQCLFSSGKDSAFFARKIHALGKYHARDQHTWEDDMCDFHPLVKEGGEPYHTACTLTCPYHSLAYEIECDQLAAEADKFIHPELGSGNTHQVESTHNVFLSFRTKNMNLQSLHYKLLTNLGLMQANMPWMLKRKGLRYHWMIQLFQRMGLPLLDGMEEALYIENKAKCGAASYRSSRKGRTKRQLAKRRHRGKEQEDRKRWGKGKHTYGSDSDGDGTPTRPSKRRKVRVGAKPCRCGSSTHMRINHRDCPLNPKNALSTNAGTSFVARSCIHVPDTRCTPEPDSLSFNPPDPYGDVSCDDYESTAGSSSEEDCEADDEGEGCTCGGGKSHSRSCPKNPRLKGRVLSFDQAPGAECRDQPLGVDCETQCSSPSSVVKLPVSVVSAEQQCASPSSEVPSEVSEASPEVGTSVETGTSSLEVGDYVAVHSSKLSSRRLHVCCRVVGCFDGRYKLYCRKGVLKSCYSGVELKCVSGTEPIPLKQWREAPQVSVQEVVADSTCLESCHCIVNDSPAIEIGDTDDEAEVSDAWVTSPLYTLTSTEREVLSSSGEWLSDAIISAAQSLMQQQFPAVSGLQHIALQETLSFDVHRSSFVQIVNVDNVHWITVSNVGCEQGTVNVYDSSFSSVYESTVNVIASLVLHPGPELKVRLMNVAKQATSGDCGVLAIAYAYAICSGLDPCLVNYDQKSIRWHLMQCLEAFCFSAFPASGRRTCKSLVKKTQVYPLHCTCRMPELTKVKYDNFAECENCKSWYHQSCLNIPDEVFGSEEINWVCDSCK